MTEKELKKLSRAEILELLLLQTRESELLQMKLEAAHAQLDSRQLQLREADKKPTYVYQDIHFIYI